METFEQLAGAGAADVLLTVTLAVAGNDCGIVARYADADNYLLFQFLQGGRVGIWRKQAGTFFSLDARLSVVQSGDVFAFSLSGPALLAYQNGNLVCGTTDGFNQQATTHGLRLNNAPGAVFGTLAVVAITGPPPPPPVLLAPARAYYPDDPVYADNEF